MTTSTERHQDLPIRYRPRTLKQVVGQPAAVAALSEILERNECRGFLLTGPSGCGKTTLARIIARHTGAEDEAVREVDAASNSGVDSVREIARQASLFSMTASGRTAIIMDECHALSSSAWQALLKPVEESRDHCTWIFLTTELEKVPKTHRTRLTQISLGLVPDRAMLRLLRRVAAAEEIPASKKRLDVITELAEGSPREALKILSASRSCKTSEGIRRLFEDGGANTESPEAYDLARLLWGRAGYPVVMRKLSQLPPSVGNETIRRVTQAGAASSFVRAAGKPRDPEWTLALLQVFNEPMPQASNRGPLIVALAELYDV